MKISKAYNKNFSINEQEKKINNIFTDSKFEKLILFNKDFIVKRKFNFFFNQIIEDEFIYIKENSIKDKETLIFSLDIFRYIIEKNILDYKIIKILSISNDKVENFLESKETNISKFSLSKKNKSYLLDSTIFSLFFINKKTTNKFSFLIINKTENIILYKRGHKKFILGIKLK